MTWVLQNEFITLNSCFKLQHYRLKIKDTNNYYNLLLGQIVSFQNELLVYKDVQYHNG